MPFKKCRLVLWEKFLIDFNAYLENQYNLSLSSCVYSFIMGFIIKIYIEHISLLCEMEICSFLNSFLNFWWIKPGNGWVFMRCVL